MFADGKTIVSLALTAILTASACDTDPSVPVRVINSKEAPQPMPAPASSAPAAATEAAEEEEILMGNGAWVAAKNWELETFSRDPFRGYVDAIYDEKLKREIERTLPDATGTLLPIQRFDVRDFKLLGVITGTANPKAIVSDSAGQRFVLKRGDLIGNKNGTVTKIMRDRIEIFELISGEGKYTEIELFEEKPNIILKMQ